MKPETVESLLARSRPGPPPPHLRKKVADAADAIRRAGPVRSGDGRIFWGRLTVAAALLVFLGSLAWLLGSPFGSEGNPSGAQQGPGHGFEEKKLHSIRENFFVREFTWSRDGKHWGYVAQSVETNQKFVVVDGKKGDDFDFVTVPQFGADGQFAYLAGGDGSADLFLNGARQAGWDRVQDVRWSPDGRKLAVVGRVGAKAFVAVGDRRSEPFDDVWELVWSPEGSTPAFAAAIGEDRFVVLGEKKGELYDQVRHLTFSPDGKKLAYAAREGLWHLVVDGVRSSREYSEIDPPVFSPDGSRIGFTARDGDAPYAVVGDEIGGALPGEVGTVVFSRDGKVWAYRNGSGAKQHVTVNRERTFKGTGVEPTPAIKRVTDSGEPFDEVSVPVLNPDGSRVAYVGAKGNRRYLVVDGKLTKKFSMIERLSFGPDGQTLAFVATQFGKQLVVAGNAQSEEFDEIVTGPVFSADGKKVGFAARRGAELWSKVLEVK